MRVLAISMPKLPGDASVFIDDQPELVVIWHLENLSAQEVAQMLADVWMLNTECGHYRRQPPVLSAA